MRATRPDFMDHSYRGIDIYVIDLDPEQFHQGIIVGLKQSLTKEELLLPFWKLEQIKDESERSVEFQIKSCINTLHKQKDNQHAVCYLFRRKNDLAIAVTDSFYDLLTLSIYEKLEID